MQWHRKMFLDRGAEVNGCEVADQHSMRSMESIFLDPFFGYEERAVIEFYYIYFIHCEQHYSRCLWQLHASDSSPLAGTILIIS